MKKPEELVSDEEVGEGPMEDYRRDVYGYSASELAETQKKALMLGILCGMLLANGVIMLKAFVESF